MLLDHPVMIRIGNLIRWLNDKCIACVVATYSCLSKNALDVLMLLSILSLFDAMPPLPTRIAHILAGIGIALWFIYSPMLVQAKFQVLMRVALATIAFVSLCWLPAPIVYYITAVWFGIASIFKFRNAHLTATLVLIMALVHDLMDCSPHALMMLNAICGRISEAFSQPLFLQSKWGMTALGWQGILLIGIAWWLGGRTEHWYYTVRRAVMLLAWIAIALLGFMALAGAFSYIADKRGWAFPVNPLTLAPIRNCLLIVPFAVWGLHERPRRRDERYHLRLSRTVTMALPFLCILATAFYRAPMLLPIYPKRADVLFLETNRTEWRLPMHPRYGQDFWGFWSRLPDYLHLMGYRRFVPVRKLTRAKLQNASIVIIINPERSPTSGESRLLEQFVARGGGLLVMGEHTDMGGMMKHLKAWLKPFDIEFNFDSAKSIFEYWRGCYKLLPSAITAGLDEREVQISIGASLKVNPPAQPLILGRLAWSDAGNRRNVREAYLGNLEYDADEPLGDINLTAIRHYKRGRVIVFGDTSTVQNSALPYAWRFIARMMDWLSGGELETRVHSLQAIAQPITAGVTAMVALAGANPYSITVSAAVGGIVHAVSELIRWLNDPPRRWLSDKRIAWVDAHHANYISFFDRARRSVDGLLINLMRSGWLPIITLAHHRLPDDPPGLLVCIEPCRRITRTEAKRWLSWLRNGMQMLIFASPRGGENLKYLLEPLGIHIRKVPLGAGAADPSDALLNYSAVGASGTNAPQLLQFSNAWAVEVKQRRIRIIARRFKLPVVVARDVGEGKLCIVADPEFPQDRYLESVSRVAPANIRFLRHLLEKVLSKPTL